MTVVDTGGVIALLDGDDRHHGRVRRLFEEEPAWIIPWAVLPEVDYIATKRLGARVAIAFLEDVREGLFAVDSAVARDLPRALALLGREAPLRNN